MKKVCLMIVLICNCCVSAAWAAAVPDVASPSAELFEARCSVCHALPDPARLDWQHWRHILHVMKQRMAERDMALSDGEWRQIAAYLKAHAR